MTTNVFDRTKNVIATDSRWSYKVFDDRINSTLAIAYVDDTGYDKIAFDVDTGYMFAGPGLVIDLWRTWALSNNQSVLKRPAVAPDFAICMTDLETGEIVMEHGQMVRDTNCRMAGTGSKPAYECWALNGDPRRAVESAALVDQRSGGEVKYLECSHGKNNLNFSVPFSSVNKLFLEKGMVMYIASPQAPVPVNLAAQNDPRIQGFVENIRKDQMSAEAPSGLDPVIWTPADEARLDDALARRAMRRKLR